MEIEFAGSDTKPTMSEFWNGEGGENWLRFQKTIRSSLHHFGETVMEESQIAEGENILDIGCGSGETTMSLVRRVGSLGSVHGVDISSLILKKTENFTLQHDNLNFDCADAQTYPFEKKNYHLVFSRFGVMFFENPLKAFLNIQLSLKSGGRLAFICWQRVQDNPWVDLPLQLAIKHAGPPEPMDAESPGPFSFSEATKVKRILTDAGFSDICIIPYHTKLTVGNTLDESVLFLTHLGPASSIINDPCLKSTIRSTIISDLHHELRPFKTSNGVELGASCWIVTAKNRLT